MPEVLTLDSPAEIMFQSPDEAAEWREMFWWALDHDRKPYDALRFVDDYICALRKRMSGLASESTLVQGPEGSVAIVHGNALNQS